MSESEYEKSLRHEKWVRVEPGTVIPAGQPYRVEWDGSDRQPLGTGSAAEYSEPTQWKVREFFKGYYYAGMFVDSSWSPPLELPEAPCVIKAVIWGGITHTLYGHFANDETQTGIVFCRAADGMTVKVDDIRSFEILWTEKSND